MYQWGRVLPRSLYRGVPFQDFKPHSNALAENFRKSLHINSQKHVLFRDGNVHEFPCTKHPDLAGVTNLW